VSRADVGLVLVVGALATFVGVQVATRDGHDQAASAPRGSAPAPAIVAQQAATPKAADTRVTVTHSAVAAPERNLDDIRSRIAQASGTYMAEMLIDLNGTLVRWPDRRQQGLRIWVQSMTAVPDWDLRYTQMARDAFADWDAGGLPMRLDFVLDSATSDIHVVWVDRFPPSVGMRVGTTSRTTDQNGWIVAADILVAIHDSTGRIIPPSSLAGIVRHEAGHAFGLGHSPDAKTKMFPVEMTSDISPADRATLRLLYQLPPGPVR
jgi:hypothetical protein